MGSDGEVQQQGGYSLDQGAEPQAPPLPTTHLCQPLQQGHPGVPSRLHSQRGGEARLHFICQQCAEGDG